MIAQFVFVFLTLSLAVSSLSYAKEKKEAPASANYSEARFLVNRDLPIEAYEIIKFIEFRIFQPPSEICLPSTPRCWIVSFDIEGKNQDTKQTELVTKILSAPLISQKEAQNYVETLKNWEKLKKSNLKFDWIRVYYPEVGSLFLIDAHPLLSFPKFLQDYKLIYKFNLPISHKFGAISDEEKPKPTIDLSNLCPKPECTHGMEILRTYGFFVLEPVFDFRVIANPKEDK